MLYEACTLLIFGANSEAVFVNFPCPFVEMNKVCDLIKYTTSEWTKMVGTCAIRARKSILWVHVGACGRNCLEDESEWPDHNGEKEYENPN